MTGAEATIGTTVNICPKLFKRIRELYYAGDIKEAKKAQSLLNSLVEVLVKVGIFPAAKCMQWSCWVSPVEYAGDQCPFLLINRKKRVKRR